LANILIVDDEALVSNILSEMFKLNKHNTFTAFNVPHAMALLELNWVDLIILDLSMPGKDGSYLLSYLDDNYPGIKVIIFSGLELGTHPLRDTIDSKCECFVPKTTSLGILQNKVEEALKN
jgi:DNA-binding NtrC family response regulator